MIDRRSRFCCYYSGERLETRASGFIRALSCWLRASQTGATTRVVLLNMSTLTFQMAWWLFTLAPCIHVGQLRGRSSKSQNKGVLLSEKNSWLTDVVERREFKVVSEVIWQMAMFSEVPVTYEFTHWRKKRDFLPALKVTVFQLKRNIVPSCHGRRTLFFCLKRSSSFFSVICAVLFWLRKADLWLPSAFEVKCSVM